MQGTVALPQGIDDKIETAACDFLEEHATPGDTDQAIVVLSLFLTSYGCIVGRVLNPDDQDQGSAHILASAVATFLANNPDQVSVFDSCLADIREEGTI